MCNCKWGSGGGGGGGDLWRYISVGVQVSLLMQSIHLGGVLENFNKSMHNIHNLSCITLRLVLLVCWLGVYYFFFFGVKLQEVARRGRTFIK